MGAIWHPGQRSVLSAGPKEDLQLTLYHYQHTALALSIRRCGIILIASSQKLCVTLSNSLVARLLTDRHRLQEGISVGEAKAQRVKKDIKLGRIQEPEDVAKLVSFLVSDEGEYITGQTIKTCGGASL